MECASMRGVCRRLCCALLVVAPGVELRAGHAQEAAARPHGQSEFHIFLEQPPWIRSWRYRRSHSYTEVYAARTPAEPLMRQPRLYVLDEFESAWQPAGWYRRSIQDALIYASYSPTRGWTFKDLPPPGLEVIVGANPQYYWRVSQEHTVVSMVPRPGQPGYAPGPDSVGARFEWELKRMLRLGLDLMGTGPLRWLDEERFEVEPIHFYGLPNPGGRGRITRRDDLGRPVEVVYTVQGAPAGFEEVRVTYGYLPDRVFPPYEILAYQRVPEEGVVVHTNYMDRLEVGLDPAGVQGYFPEQFRAAHVPLARLLVYSNDILYRVTMDGRFEEVPNVPYEPLPRVPSQALLRTVLVGVLVAGGLATGWSLWMRWRRSRTGTVRNTAP